MGFAQCPWPIWRLDDLSSCFQQDYLQVLFPLVVIFLSLACLAWSVFGHLITDVKSRPYQALSDDYRENSSLVASPDLATPDDSPLEINGGGRLALVKTTSRGSIIQSDTPPGHFLFQLAEILALAALVACHVVALATGAYGTAGHPAAVTGLVIWTYTLLIVSLRLLLHPSTQPPLPSLWKHTATIYGLNWLFSLFVFRSVLIHPRPRLASILLITSFSLISLLFVMAFTIRKGNKTVLMEWEDGIEPSREPLASLFSLASFAWVDAIVYRGWKGALEMKHVWNLLPKDKAAAVLGDYRRHRKRGALVWHLLRYFKKMLLYQCFLAFIAGLFTFAPTLLLRAILEYVERPEEAPISVLWLYVIALPILDTIRSYADGMALWIGRKICIRVRAIIVADIYAKALRRKAAATREKVLLDDKSPAASVSGKAKKSTLAAASSSSSVGTAADDASRRRRPTDDDEQANMGTIINLMSVDSFKISDVTAYLHFLGAAAPTQLLISVVLLWQVMGLSAVPGLIVMALLLPVNYFLARGFNITSKNIMTATDRRISVTNEVLQSIRIIKYFAWEERFGRIIDERRRAELVALRSRFIIWAIAVAIWNSVPVLITFFSFLVYTVVEKKPLYPSVAFTAISLFMLLRVPLDQFGDMFAHVQEAKVSIDRVEEFLNEEETEKYEQLGPDNVDEDGQERIGFRRATLIWGGRDTVAEDGSRAFRLLDLDVDFRLGKLNIIVGPTGSGKTSMLMGLLGEMTLVQGKVFCPGGRSREEVRPDPATGLADTIAYVAQSAWLINASIRDNILFAMPFDEQRYRDVIVACALERDLEILDHGDETLVGEKGITMSGGQKQRISLARALYSNSAHLLMDDCLSAVDSHTAQWIFANCIQGPLMRGRTCVLVTHNIQLCVPSSDYVVVLDNGRVAAQGPPQMVIDSGLLGNDIRRSRPASGPASRVPSRVPSSIGGSETVVNGGVMGVSDGGPRRSKSKPAGSAPEGKAIGSVKWPVMKLYLSAMGPWWFWAITLVVFILQQLSTVATNVWVREWANKYVLDPVLGSDATLRPLSRTYTHQASVGGIWASIARLGWVQDAAAAVSAVGVLQQQQQQQQQQVNVAYYLTGLAAIGAAGALMALIRDVWIFFGSLTASRRLHDRLISAVTRAKFTFFDVTPLGQLMNRFSKDLEAVDQEIAPTAIGVMTCALSLVVTIILISIITPGFLVAAVLIGGLFYLVATLYLRASRDLKRLESIQRSPLFQQFGETLSGVTTIRAYGDQRRFIRDNLAKVNTQNRPFIYLWACNRWLAFRADALGNMVSFFAGVFIIMNLGRIDAGAAGISLSYAMNFTENLLWFVRQYGMNEQNMNAMERVKEYLDLEQEAPAVVEEKRPPASWPERGEVEIVDYTTRYRRDLEPVLRGISLKIRDKEKVGIVGRTGAGKSSLALAIFRALEAEKGRIVIDGIDIGTLGLRDLRERITIVPQDPTLFRGTLRSNLDPFGQYSDEEVFEALRRVQLIGPVQPQEEEEEVTRAEVEEDEEATTVTTAGDDDEDGGRGNLNGRRETNQNVFLDLSWPVVESGSNLSQGQRQLLCLARAMLKKPTVLVMDEATASIDYATDSKIQETIRDLTGTVVTIAHRLQTIVDYDKVLVLDRGEVVEYGHPWKLIRDEQGMFRSMCEMSGELEMLMTAAKRKWDEDGGGGERETGVA